MTSFWNIAGKGTANTIPMAIDRPIQILFIVNIHFLVRINADKIYEKTEYLLEKPPAREGRGNILISK
jgi:hypothetical protein